MVNDTDDSGLPIFSQTEITAVFTRDDQSRLDKAVSRLLAKTREGDCHGFSSHIADDLG